MKYDRVEVPLIFLPLLPKETPLITELGMPFSSSYFKIVLQNLSIYTHTYIYDVSIYIYIYTNIYYNSYMQK